MTMHRCAAILLNVGGKKITDEDVAEEIRKLSKEFVTTPVIVLADTNELTQIMKALEYGARGYIPSSVGIDVCVEAIKLALAGGIFVPASSVLAMRQLIDSGGETKRPVFNMFTDRQAEVVEALRRGKPNKIIAYELNLRESTVKVHIRNIMKKLKATNRTEVVYKINDLFSGEFVVRTGKWILHGGVTKIDLADPHIWRGSQFPPRIMDGRFARTCLPVVAIQRSERLAWLIRPEPDHTGRHSPVPRKITDGVISKIRMSVANDMTSAYRVSCFARSAKEHPLRSLTGHSPVNPGRISK